MVWCELILTESSQSRVQHLTWLIQNCRFFRLIAQGNLIQKSPPRYRFPIAKLEKKLHTQCYFLIIFYDNLHCGKLCKKFYALPHRTCEIRSFWCATCVQQKLADLLIRISYMNYLIENETENTKKTFGQHRNRAKQA